MKTIIWVSDFFVDEISGGAEICDEAAIKALEREMYLVKKIKTKDLSKELIEQHSRNLWIISNFVQIQNYELMKYMFESDIKYVHYSHDSIFCMHRNPYKHGPKMKCECWPEDGPLHTFLNNATAIVCQSNWHKSIWEKNVNNPRIITFGSNLWSNEILDYISKKLEERINKNEKYIIFESPYDHKNTKGAIEYANENKLEYELVKDLSQEQFIDKLVQSKGIIFMPLLAESLSRLIVEARMCNCSIKTNNLCGATKEEWFIELKGKELVKYIKEVPPKRFTGFMTTLIEGVL